MQRRGHCRVQRRQLAVDLDPQRLKGALGRMAPVPASRCGDILVDHLNQLSGGLEGPPGPLRHDRGGNPAGEALLPVLPQYPTQITFRIAVEHVGGSRSRGGIHAHVQHGIAGIGETTFGRVKLQRGHAQVEQHAVDVRDLKSAQNPR